MSGPWTINHVDDLMHHIIRFEENPGRDIFVKRGMNKKALNNSQGVAQFLCDCLNDSEPKKRKRLKKRK